MEGARAPGARPDPAGFEEPPLELLRTRRSVKWTLHPPDVLPAFVAETDFSLAPPIRAALAAAVERGDTGYPSPDRLGEAFAAFARRRYGLEVDPARVRAAPDVMTSVAELLRALTAPGDAVVVNPPVYPPFFGVTAETGRRVVEAPLLGAEHGYALDLDALERRFAEGARAYLLCHPHNPSGRSYRLAELEAVAALADRHGVAVIVDEVHAPLTLPGATHVPYLALGGAAAEHGVAIVSASKGWNVPGLKCALVVTASAAMEARLEPSLSPFLGYHAGHLGVLAALAAFEQGEPWLDALLSRLDSNRSALGAWIAAELPALGYLPPQAGYLAWLDFRALGLGDDPAAVLLERGRVALSAGLPFGASGAGFARLNFGTSPVLLDEALARVAAGVRSAQAG